MVSIVMPVFNAEKYLSISIDSVLKQSFDQFELIIVDDGSTDSSRFIIRYFESIDNRIRVFFRENSGIVDTLNFGISEAKFDIICRMDSDDICDTRRIEVQLNSIEKYDIVGSNVYIIDSYNEKKGELVMPESKKLIVANLFKLKASFVHPSIMFKKSKLKLTQSGDVYSKMYTHCEDLELWLRNIDYCSMHNIQNYLLCLRKHDSNISLLKFEEQLINSWVTILAYKKNIHLDFEMYASIVSNINKKIASFTGFKFLFNVNANNSKYSQYIYARLIQFISFNEFNKIVCFFIVTLILEI